MIYAQNSVMLSSRSSFLSFDLRTRITSPPALLLLVWAAAIVFLSLYPWGGWRSMPADAWAFLNEPWPRYWTAYDLTVNILAYMPLGFLLVVLLFKPVNRESTLAQMLFLLIGTTACGSLLSFALECAQAWLPNRVPSLPDWIMNSIGTLMGGACALALTQWLQHGLLVSSSEITSSSYWSRLPPGRLSLGLLTLALWIFSQASPQRLLFGNGEFGDFLEIEIPTVDLNDSGILEAFLVMSQMCIISVLVWTTLSRQLARRLGLVVALGGALLVKSTSSSWLVSEAEPLWWLTPGAQGGLLLGGIGIALIITLRPSTQSKIAQALLVLVTLLVNLAPENPFFETMINRWDEGRWSSLHALVQTVAYLWPILAFIYFWLARLAYNQRTQRTERRTGNLPIKPR
jgi:VanZ family protein